MKKDMKNYFQSFLLRDEPVFELYDIIDPYKSKDQVYEQFIEIKYIDNEQ